MIAEVHLPLTVPCLHVEDNKITQVKQQWEFRITQPGNTGLPARSS